MDCVVRTIKVNLWKMIDITYAHILFYSYILTFHGVLDTFKEYVYYSVLLDEIYQILLVVLYSWVWSWPTTECGSKIYF